MSDPTDSTPDAPRPNPDAGQPAAPTDAVGGGTTAPAAAGAGEPAAGAPIPEEAFAPAEVPQEGAEEAPSAGAEPDEDATAEAEARPASATVRARARVRALARFAEGLGGVAPERAEWLANALEKGAEPAFLARFRREKTGGMDERDLAEARRGWRLVTSEEERREELLDLVRARGASSPELEERLAKARGIPAMEDHAAPWLPVTASRATVARGHGLQALADAILHAKDATPLADLARPFVKEGTEVAGLDVALAGARDILAEALVLDAGLRARLRELFRREAVLTVGLKNEKKPDVGRHGALVGFSAPATKVPPLKLLAIRRGERERALATTIEPVEARAIEIVLSAAGAVAGADHPHAGFVRAAAEDGYRRLLRPLLTAELRTELKARADAAAIDTFDRSLKNLLLGPVGGPRKTLGIQPDVTAGHRTGAVDEQGRPIHVGRLPHEATAGREATVAALKDLLEVHGIEVVAVGSSNGRRDVLDLAEAAKASLGRDVLVTEVHDAGARTLEAQGVGKAVRTEGGTEIPPEFLGALSVARRFQDPLAEYVRLDPRTLGLGPNLHDVHQGRLREALDDATTFCVTHVGVEATTADAHLLAKLPGMDMGKAKAFVAWRDAGGALTGKAALGAVDGVGLAAAERAVGFLRVATSKDPRDRTQLHPEQFGLLDEMATQLETDVPTLFREPKARAAVDLGRLAREEAPIPTLRYVLWQAAEGIADPRPRFAVPTKPPADVTLRTLRPGLLLEGKVTRSVPFGLFVDVGLGAEALVPIPHIGDRPGIEPATIAPVGAVVHARVLEVDIAKRRLTLSMRPDRDRPPMRGGPRDDRRPPRRDDRRPGGPREAVPAGAPGAPGAPSGPGAEARPARGPAGRGRGPGGPREGGAPPKTFDRRAGRGDAAGGAKAGGKGGGGGGFRDRPSSAGAGGFAKRGGRDEGRRFDRDDPSAPRRISLPMEAGPSEQPAPEVAETPLSPAEELARKLDALRRKLSRPE